MSELFFLLISTPYYLGFYEFIPFNHFLHHYLHDEAESNQVEALPLFDFMIKSAKRGLASCQ